jgi:hypothetical protein
VYLLEQGRARRQALYEAGLHVGHYSDGGVRITVGDRVSTRAVLAAIAKSAALTTLVANRPLQQSLPLVLRKLLSCSSGHAAVCVAIGNHRQPADRSADVPAEWGSMLGVWRHEMGSLRGQFGNMSKSGIVITKE